MNENIWTHKAWLPHETIAAAKMEELYLVQLLGAALHQLVPPEPTDAIDLTLLFDFAAAHNVLAMAGEAFGKTKRWQVLAQELQADLSTRVGKTHAVNITQHYEAEQLFASFDARELSYIPMKGWYLQDFYPEKYLRGMGDIDILIPREQMQSAGELAISLGYVPESLTEYHIEYTKPPCMLLELHQTMTDGDAGQFFLDVWNRAVKRKGHEYRLSDVDFYLFMIHHGAKHIRLGGIGLRYVTDLWVFLRHFAQNGCSGFDLSEAVSGLNTLGLSTFAACSERLARMWFGDTGLLVLPDENISVRAINGLGAHILASESFGNKKSCYQTQILLQKNQDGTAYKSRLLFMFKKAFPSLALMLPNYPVLRRMPFLLPLFWPVRLFNKFFRGNRAGMVGLKTAFAISDEEQVQRELLLRDIGLLK